MLFTNCSHLFQKMSNTFLGWYGILCLQPNLHEHKATPKNTQKRDELSRACSVTLGALSPPPGCGGGQTTTRISCLHTSRACTIKIPVLSSGRAGIFLTFESTFVDRFLHLWYNKTVLKVQRARGMRTQAAGGLGYTPGKGVSKCLSPLRFTFSSVL